MKSKSVTASASAPSGLSDVAKGFLKDQPSTSELTNVEVKDEESAILLLNQVPSQKYMTVSSKAASCIHELLIFFPHSFALVLNS